MAEHQMSAFMRDRESLPVGMMARIHADHYSFVISRKNACEFSFKGRKLDPRTQMRRNRFNRDWSTLDPAFNQHLLYGLPYDSA
jgi:hypothetical protein